MRDKEWVGLGLFYIGLAPLILVVLNLLEASLMFTIMGAGILLGCVIHSRPSVIQREKEEQKQRELKEKHIEELENRIDDINEVIQDKIDQVCGVTDDRIELNKVRDELDKLIDDNEGKC
jgi:gas vesicle protein